MILLTHTPKIATDKVLLLEFEKISTYKKQTKTKSQKTLGLKITIPLETVSFDIPLKLEGDSFDHETNGR